MNSSNFSKAILTLCILTAAVVVGAAQKSRPSVTAAEVNGTFKMNFRGKYKKMSNEIKILALGGGKIRFAMDLIYPYTLKRGEISVNMGGLDGEASIVGDTAVYESEEFGKCKITFKFVKPGSVKVVEDGTDAGCGFGHNVTAAGNYRKASSRKPTF